MTQTSSAGGWAEAVTAAAGRRRWEVLRFGTDSAGELIVFAGQLNGGWVRRRLSKAVSRAV